MCFTGLSPPLTLISAQRMSANCIHSNYYSRNSVFACHVGSI